MIGGVASLGFYYLVLDFIKDEIEAFQGQLLSRFAGLLGIVALSILTIWVFLQGWRVVSGRSREPMMALVGDALKAMIIVGVATGWAGNSSTLYSTLTTGLGSAVYGAVTGEENKLDGLYETMNENMALTTIALGAVSSAQSGEDGQVTGESLMMGFMSVLGTGGPALAGGTMLALNQVAMALFTGFGPLFILCLLFDATKSLFSRWLLYGLGTMFSLAVLYVMTTICTRAMASVATAYWISSAMSLASGDGLRTVAIQTSGLGLILTAMLVTAPPMAAMFFQGTLGQFSPYAAIGPGSSTSPNGQSAPITVQTQSSRAPQIGMNQAGTQLIPASSNSSYGASTRYADNEKRGALGAANRQGDA
ncbi:type IV secretion system protein [Pseudoxanthomonas winnipegensis]|uniref:Type IV secretion system protein n=1 Tax=Pseudoxanthomonas winnipegensis TaxID=2480810 RepID=A0A4V6ML17_9GAMM|nr:type IV secretion system protein [Pseudoxanthomonas winnipegensis]TAA45698.1 type IV secretion system protein [Pseudoxanthomonas winnipegensis]